ncbi:MAG TPA: DNA-3-methyladenine glycosylase [Terriglobales bacterium]|nr:DNA-3-methyladenine glycosylase [Terriglobales bacterium]
MSKPRPEPQPQLRPESLARLPMLARKFYDRDPRQAAPELLGKILVRGSGLRSLAARIVEVEVYLGAGDLAAHAAFGLTPRNAVLFGPPGHAYVYFTYGMHFCLNVSCMLPGEAGSVLFRAAEPLAGLAAMARNRHLMLREIRHPRILSSGPARLCQAFGITRPRDNGKDLTSKRSDLRIVDDSFVPESIGISKRIGITKSPDLPLRYYIASSEFVSR